MNKTPVRYYVVTTHGDTDDPRLVKAPTAAQAIRHVTKSSAAKVASQDDIVRLLGAGVVPEDAGDKT